MLKMLQTLGTGATLAIAKAHGATGAVEPVDAPPKFGEAATTAQRPDAVSTSTNAGRRALYDGGLPFCNEVFPGGETRGERFGQRDAFGLRTCQGPAIPGCGQPLFNGAPYAYQYPGRTCVLPDGLVRIGK